MVRRGPSFPPAITNKRKCHGTNLQLPNDITLMTPLRLNIAAELAFPDGSMTGSGLMNEHRQGRLEIERIDGKAYVTLAEIGKMRERCRVMAKSGDRIGAGPPPANANVKIVTKVC